MLSLRQLEENIARNFVISEINDQSLVSFVLGSENGELFEMTIEWPCSAGQGRKRKKLEKWEGLKTWLDAILQHFLCFDTLEILHSG